MFKGMFKEGEEKTAHCHQVSNNTPDNNIYLSKKNKINVFLEGIKMLHGKNNILIKIAHRYDLFCQGQVINIIRVGKQSI